MTGFKADIAEMENQEPIADQVITMEPELNLSFCRVLFTFNKYSLFLTSLVICVHETVGLWRVDIVTVILCGCAILVSYVKRRTQIEGL